MADEANFCLNCGENLAKWRTGSGFVKEVAQAEGASPPSPARAPAPEGSPAGGAPRERPREPNVELSVRGAEMARPVSGTRHLNTLLSEGRAAAESRDLDKSLKAFREALELDPDSEDALYGIGVVYGRLGRQLDALSTFNRLVESNPRLAAGFDGRGAALANLGRLGEAVTAFDEAIRLDPMLASARLEKGAALSRMDDLKGAVACFDAVLELEPGNAVALLSRGEALVRLGDNAGALRSFDRALETAPMEPTAWRRKGELLLKMGHAADARRCFDRALQLDANDADAVVRRGDALRQGGDPAGAIDSYEKAALMRPGRAEPLVRKGLLLFSLSKFPSARDAFARARELEPDNQVAAVNLAVALYRCREFAAAKAEAESALLRWPGQVDLARVLAASGRKLRTAGAPVGTRGVQPPGTDHTVEDIFIIYRDGRLINHQTRRLRADMDNQLLSGMLTAIQSFIQEAFREGDEGRLSEMSFGKNQILIERGKWISIAVVIHGVPPIGARAEVAFAVQSIEELHGSRLAAWDGETANLRGIGDAAGRILEVL